MEEGALIYDIFEFDLIYRGKIVEINHDNNSPFGHNFTINIEYFGEVGIARDKLDLHMSFSHLFSPFGNEPPWLSQIIPGINLDWQVQYHYEGFDDSYYASERIPKGSY